MSGIVWKPQGDDGAFAKRNGRIIGFIGQKPSGKWFYQLDAFYTKWITKGRGEVGSKAQAKKSLIRAWTDCLNHFGLEHREDDDLRNRVAAILQSQIKGWPEGCWGGSPNQAYADGRLHGAEQIYEQLRDMLEQVTVNGVGD